jgi:FkbM family methyltransferase
MVTIRTVGLWLTNVFPAFRGHARAFYQRLPACFRDTPIRLITSIFPQHLPFFFINIGANDGIAGDPLAELIKSNHRCSGVFVEPVPFLFRRLCRNFGSADRFIFENVAINDRAGTRTFYYLDCQKFGENQLPDWSEQVGSFEKSHILRHFPGLDASQIMTADVECITLPELIERHGIRQVDILVMDVEGYEVIILSQIDFKKIRPRLIMYEHKHLSDGDSRLAREILTSNGYRIAQYDRDTIGLRKN